MRKFLIGLLAFILINTIGLLILSYTIKDILVDGIIKEVIVNQVSMSKYKEANYQINTDENINKITNNEQVKEILKSKEVNELINKYLDIAVTGLIDEEKLDEIDLEKDIMDYLRNNKDELEKITGKEITEEQLNETETELRNRGINEMVKNSISATSKSMPKEAKVVLKGYQTFISFKFRLILIIISIIDIVLIALLQKSFYKWIKTLAIVLITNGIFAIITSTIVYLIVYSLTRIKFNTSSLLISGIIITIIGVLTVIMYNIFTNRKEEQTYEIS